MKCTHFIHFKLMERPLPSRENLWFCMLGTADSIEIMDFRCSSMSMLCFFCIDVWWQMFATWSIVPRKTNNLVLP